METRPRRFWKDYMTPAGARPVRDALMNLSSADRARVLAAMHDVAVSGLAAARHLHGDIYEVRTDGRDAAFRVLFAAEGHRGQVLLALEFIVKRTQKTPDRTIRLAQHRLAAHRVQGRRRGRLPDA